MNKEYSEALERLYKCNDDDYTLGYQQHDYKLLQQALQRLESIDNANPSEALEKLEMLSDCAVAMKEAPSSNWIQYAKTEAELDLKLHFAYLDLKQVLLKAQENEKDNARNEEILQKYYQEGITLDSVRALKQERDNYKKVLSIIKEKNVDIKLLKLSSSWLDYYTRVKHKTGYNTELTEEEFDLLKRWLG